MSSTEHALNLSIEKANNNEFTAEEFDNELARLKSAVIIELEPLRRAGQNNYANYLHGILAQFEALRPESLPKPPFLLPSKDIFEAKRDSLVFEN